MAFKNFKTAREAITLDELGARIAARRAVVSPIDVPRNSGTRRTESKKALLKEIAKLGGDW